MLKILPASSNPHAQDGSQTDVLMDDTAKLMDDPGAIMGGPITNDRTPTTRIVVKEKSVVK